MRQLIPHFILKRFEENKFEGILEASVIFIDISGFTAMTQTLMQNGEEGAEILTEIINRIFTPAIEIIYQSGGFISTFAGDAFTAIFSNTTKTQSIYASVNVVKNIMKIFKEIGLQTTRFGEFNLSIKIGISYGSVNWAILKGTKTSSYYFKGDAINNSANCEHFCGSNEIVTDSSILEFAEIKVTKIDKAGYYLVKNIDDFLKTDEIIDRSVDKNFFNFVPGSIIDSNIVGEFRNIIPCFISFEENNSMISGISKVINLSSQYGGYFNKIDFGDKGGIIIILFGAPTAQEKLVNRALDFAISLNKMSNNDFNCRIALTSGLVYAGFIGSELRGEYTALGAIVNLSARLMMRAKFGDIVVDDSIKNSTGNLYNFDFVNEASFKGFKEKISYYKLREKAEINLNNSFTNKFVGRQQELENLKSKLQPLYENKCGGVVYIDGPGGIGKTRMVNELKATLNLETISWFLMPCDEILRKSFNPIISFLKSYFHQSEHNDIAQNKKNFEDKITSLIEKTNESSLKKELIRTKSVLGAIISLFWENSLYEHLDAKGKHENKIFAVKNLIKAESRQKPVIIELDDGHWIDVDSNEFLHNLMRNTEQYPFIIISACRFNDDGKEFYFGINSLKEQRILLEYFSEESARKMISENLKNYTINTKNENLIIPDGTVELVLDKSEGNPFYIEQIMLYLKENSLLNDDLSLAVENFEIPSTINSIIIARIDKLTNTQKEIVKTASILGREFSFTVLKEMLKIINIAQEINEIENETIWDKVSELNYIFKHSMIRETVYNMQLKRRLRYLHLLAAQTIERLYFEKLIDYFGELANHYEKAEQFSQAISYNNKAGDAEKDNYNNLQALKYYDRIIENVKNINEKEGKNSLLVDAQLKKIKILGIIGQWKNAKDLCFKVLKTAKKMGEINKIAEAKNNLGQFLMQEGNYDESLKYFNEAYIEFEQINSIKGMANTTGNKGNIFSMTGNSKDAMNCYKERLELSTQIDDKAGISASIGNIGIVYKNMGKFDDAMECYQKRISLAEKLQDIRGLAATIGNMGIVFHIQGNSQKALECFEKKLELNEKAGDKHGISQALGYMGSAYYNQEKFALSMEYYSRHLAIAQELGDIKGLAINFVNMGVSYTELGEYLKAIDYCSKSLKLAESLNSKNLISIASGNLGSAYLAVNELDNALLQFEKAINICLEINNKNYLQYWYCEKAETLFKMKKFKLSKQINDQCLSICKVDELQMKSAVLDGKLALVSENIHFDRFKTIHKSLLEKFTKEEFLGHLNYSFYFIALELLNHKNLSNEEKNYLFFIREKAITFYNKISKKSEKFLYKQRLEQLEKQNYPK